MGSETKQRIVVKIGSSLLTDEDGRLSLEKLRGHVAAISRAKEAGHAVLLVTSAAIAAGFEKLGFSKRPKTVVQKQACAAVGQGLLMQAYAEAFSEKNIVVAQVLLTKRDMAIRESYNNAMNTLEFLLDRGVVPIINQNDTTAIEEISFGDNDSLAARVAALLHADLCIIFTDTAGLYDSDPTQNSDARKIPYVEKITPEILALASSSKSGVGTGGMRSKILAAEVAISMGTNVFVGDGRDIEDDMKILKILERNGAGTYFGAPQHGQMQRKKQWIALHSDVQGTLVIDDGAVEALTKSGHSLLVVGVVDVFGDFEEGAVLEVRDLKGRLVGKGVVNYAADLLRKIVRKEDAAAISQGEALTEVIHRDDWVQNENAA